MIFRIKHILEIFIVSIIENDDKYPPPKLIDK